jgi:uncharacterized protein (DUF302 family)
MSSSGVFDVRSGHSVTETVDRLERLAKAAGLLVFARIDFSADAAKAGLTLRPMQQIVFGNPKAGTPLLVAAPRAGLDLPLKALVWEDETGAVWASMNAPEYLETRHGLPHDLLANIAGARALVEKAVG